MMSKEMNESKSRFSESGTQFWNILRRNWHSGSGGTYAVCSSHPRVIDAAVRQSIADDSLFHVESTSSQVNQFGGYSGQTPEQFARFVKSAAQRAGLPLERVLLGGDHLGPFPWRNEAANAAMEKACELVRQCVRAGYQKIHLDPSMPCANDELLTESIIAKRAAILCAVAENASRDLPAGGQLPVYVIGTEVPAPGGELGAAHGPRVTSADDVHRTLEIFRREFRARDLSAAWERVVALVVQPGLDFDADTIFDYDPANARTLSAALAAHEGMVYEAHSTDYQTPAALAQMVRDHFAILKVGPWLTFAYREAVLALSNIERELLPTSSGMRLSEVREALLSAMRSNPRHWRSYYPGDETQVSRSLIYGYSDRCRYYWNDPGVQEETARLLENLSGRTIPLPLLSQYLPEEYEAIRSGRIQAVPEQIVEGHIRQVMRRYAPACAAG
jgi:D-tagatose-1,6-bisphosphate aldolase subunit GatZ/KbaZ